VEGVSGQSSRIHRRQWHMREGAPSPAAPAGLGRNGALQATTGSAQKKEALELPSCKVKPFQQSTESSRREICPRADPETPGIDQRHKASVRDCVQDGEK